MNRDPQGGFPNAVGNNSRARPAILMLLTTPRTLAVALLSAAAFTLLVAVPTDLIHTPAFSRQIPPTWWAWPALLASSVLGGLVAATYVRTDANSSDQGPTVRNSGDQGTRNDQSAEDYQDRASRGGSAAAGLLTFFAVGCPLRNKLVLLALGATGAVTWFAPVQPFLQAAALGVVTWALIRRLRSQSSCPLPASTPARTR